MKKGILTRGDAIKAIGLSAVTLLDKVNCFPTNRKDAELEQSGLTERAAAEMISGGNTLIGYCYTTKEQEQKIAEHHGDCSCISCRIIGYTISGNDKV